MCISFLDSLTCSLLLLSSRQWLCAPLPAVLSFLDTALCCECRDKTALDSNLQEWLSACEPAFDLLLSQLFVKHQQRSKLPQ